MVDHGSVNVALPTIAEHFHTDLPTVQWVIIGYALTISATLLPMGRVSDMLGRKEVYLFGSVVYVISAALVGSSQDFAFLILFRIMQGIGGAMTQGTGMAIIMQIFPPNERGRAVGLVMTIVGTGQVAGPAIGGGLVSWLGWRAVFFLNVPLVLIGIIATVMLLDSGRALRAALGVVQGRFDWTGAVLSTGALVTMLLAIMYGHRRMDIGLDSDSGGVFRCPYDHVHLLGASSCLSDAGHPVLPGQDLFLRRGRRFPDIPGKFVDPVPDALLSSGGAGL